MDNISFDIFIPNKSKHRLSANAILAMCFVLCFLLHVSLTHYVKGIDSICAFAFVCTFIILIFRSHMCIQPLNGYFNGRIYLQGKDLMIGEEEVDLDSINSVDLVLNDFRGQKAIYYHSLECRISQGVNNYILLDYKNGNSKKTFFRMQSKNSYLLLADFINAAVAKNKISQSRAEELIGKQNLKPKN
ncbi:hypothetical protein [uncultured Mucilaginibacter sp.]|uniref:hypothetical protein n=2 Tax=Mucilaginibacter TaxID=423349 RepID=UPI00095C4BB7|nr:hypothetical protein [uncultured Mucilaginibacter sp.]OJW17172.1 MAG: hypothetical protein BGO48_06340 [Mucilaginibacter sp. 44-25]PLW88427.1 MAG: hypothetical protein C0154_16750 [Mucilaginibacter sp.]HEK21793.1 hypothetical protein [Bacteroidota bacterium]